MADDLLIAMIIAGFGLSGIYFRAVFILWRKNQAAERKKEIILRKLHSDRLRGDENDAPGSSLVRRGKRFDEKAGTHGAITDGEIRPSVDREPRRSAQQGN
jgi:hypothetical protein